MASDVIDNILSKNIILHNLTCAWIII